MNGRFSIRLFTTGGVMCGSVSRSFSPAPLGSTSPLPACPRTGVDRTAASATTPTTTPIAVLPCMSSLLAVDSWRQRARPPGPARVRVGEADQPQLQHHAGSEQRRILRVHHFPDQV